MQDFIFRQYLGYQCGVILNGIKEKMVNVKLGYKVLFDISYISILIGYGQSVSFLNYEKYILVV